MNQFTHTCPKQWRRTTSSLVMGAMAVVAWVAVGGTGSVGSAIGGSVAWAQSAPSAGTSRPASASARRGFSLRNVPTEVRNSPIRIEMLGDSLTSGYRLPTFQALPFVMQELLVKRGYEGIEIVNSGVSGDTSGDGLERVDWVLQGPVDGLIVALGANDIIRGLPPIDLYRNLAQIVSKAQGRKIPVLVVGMRGGLQYGSEYVKAYDTVYRTLVKTKETLFYPFMLEGVALDPSLNTRDGVHPNAEGMKVIAERMVPIVEKMALEILQKRTAEYAVVLEERKREAEKKAAEAAALFAEQQRLEAERVKLAKKQPKLSAEAVRAEQRRQRLKSRLDESRAGNVGLAPFLLSSG